MQDRVIFVNDLFQKNINDVSRSTIWWNGILELLDYDVYYYDYNEYKFETLLNLIKRESPKFIIHPTLCKVHEEFNELRKYTEVFILQSDDAWRYESFSKLWIPYVDGIITFEGEENNYRRDGFTGKFCKMIWGYNPHTMFIPNMNKTFTKDILVSFYGGVHADRTLRINRLIYKGLNITISKFGSYYDVLNLLLKSKFSLNFTWNSTMSIREPKGRLVEIPAFRCALLTEIFPQIDSYYDPDEYILFDNDEEVIDKINYYLNNINEYNKIVDKSFKRIWTTNNAIYQWNNILPTLDERYKKKNTDKILNELKREIWGV